MNKVSNANYSNLQERNAQIINDIKSLQNTERELFNNLEQSLSQNTLNKSQKEELIQKINEISQMRSNMYETIGGVNSFYKTNLNTSSNTLEQQTAAINIVEKELNAAKKRLKKIEEYKLHKLRLVEINNYYGERYAAHSDLMKIIIYMFVPILILAILTNRGILPLSIFSIIVVLIGVFGTIKLYHTIRSMMMRDNMQYQEYDWNFNPDTAPKASPNASAKDPWALSGDGNICIGQACCDDGYTYNSAENKCLPSSPVSRSSSKPSGSNISSTSNSGSTSGFKYNTGASTLGASAAGASADLGAGLGKNFDRLFETGVPSKDVVSDVFTKYARAAENKKPDYTIGNKLPISYASM
jgi:hypothetical protein